MHCPHCSIALPPDSRFCASCGRSLAGAPGPVAARSTTWIVVLVVCGAALWIVAVLGILAAIAIPNLLNAIDRGKQKRTMADLRILATALAGYSASHHAYPVCADIETLRAQLAEQGSRPLPRVDGWSHPFHVASDGGSYELISAGKDGVLGGCGNGQTAGFDDDICLRNGEFTQQPRSFQP
ncbi:MAG TPA: type II secretion system protein GspG [Candidatus Polarisedimenticolaceae bacterium]|nr:type II secretion system protein GspG [Candidatus Polarisedimenticolaceae bacterium]